MVLIPFRLKMLQVKTSIRFKPALPRTGGLRLSYLRFFSYSIVY